MGWGFRRTKEEDGKLSLVILRSRWAIWHDLWCGDDRALKEVFLGIYGLRWLQEAFFDN